VEEGRSLGFGVIKIKGLLFSWGRGLTLTPLLKRFLFIVPVGKLGNSGDLLSGICLLCMM
jgi:hypothetical protein